MRSAEPGVSGGDGEGEEAIELRLFEDGRAEAECRLAACVGADERFTVCDERVAVG